MRKELLVFLFLLILLSGLVSAVWWNPSSWFSSPISFSPNTMVTSGLIQDYNFSGDNYFNGSRIFSITDAFDPTAYTVSLWVRPEYLNNQNIFVRTGVAGPAFSWSHQIRINNGTYENYLWDGTYRTLTGISPVILGKWTYIVATANNGGKMKLYVDGVLNAESSFNIGNMWTDGNRYLVGSSSGAGMSSYRGGLGNLLIFDRVLNDSEINQIYNEQRGTLGWEIVIVCSDYTYSNWSTCANGIQTRTVLSSYPVGCSVGTPVINQSCTIVSNSTCFDSDVTNSHYGLGYTSSSINGELSDYCSGNVVFESVCTNDNRSNYTSSYICENGCSNGACLSAPSNVTNVTCIDSDGGLDYFTKGNLTEDGKLYRGSIDFCQTNSSLFEFDCGWENGITGSCHSGEGGCNYVCPNGCSNGACLTQVTPSTCEGGDSYKIRAVNFAEGEVSLENYANGSWYQFCTDAGVGDYCVIGNLYMKVDAISRIDKTVELNITSDGHADIPAVGQFDYKQIDSGDFKEFVILGTKSIIFDKDTDDFIVASICPESPCSSGCSFSNTCVPIGYRSNGKYCSLNGQFTSQYNESSVCENNFECSTNQCIDGECISSTLWQRIIGWFRTLFG